MIYDPPFRVIEDFLPKKYFYLIKNEILGINFPWYFRDNITDNNKNIDNREYGFSHKIYDRENNYSSSFHHILTGLYCNILEITEKENIDRCRLDMTTYGGEKFLHKYHVDLYKPHIACVFYINNSDGKTVLYDKKCFSSSDLENVNPDCLTEMIRIKPEENKLLIFDGSYLHTGQSPSNYKRRIVLNVDVS